MNESYKQIVSRWLPYLLIGVLWLTFYHRFLLFGEIYVAPTPSAMIPSTADGIVLSDSYQRDKSLSLYPLWHYLHTLWQNGETPQWNPYAFAGMPFLPLSGFYAPDQILTGYLMPWLDSPTSYMVAMMWRSAMALLFLTLIFRKFETGGWRVAAGVAVTYFSLPILVWSHRSFDPVYLFLGTLWAATNFWDAEASRHRWGWASAVGLGLTALFYTRQIHLAICFGFVLVAYFIVRAILDKIGGKNGSDILGRLAIAALTIGAAVAATSYHWLPFFEMSLHSYRTVLPKSSGGFIPYLNMGLFYFPGIGYLQNVLGTLGLPELHPISPVLDNFVGEFENTQLGLFLFHKSLGTMNGLYRSPAYYLFLAFLLLEPKTRKQALPFLSTFTAILVGYNLIAYANMLIPVPAGLLTAVNWHYVVVTAGNSVLLICFGFGTIALLRSAEQWARSSPLLRIRHQSLNVKRICVAAGLSACCVLVWLAAKAQILAAIGDRARSLVIDMYHEQGPTFLNRIISGRHVHPVEFYTRKAVSAVDAFGTVGDLALIVICPTLLVVIALLPRMRRIGQGGLFDRYRAILTLFVPLLVGWVLLQLMVGVQIRAQSGDIAESIASRLVELDLDPEISGTTAESVRSSILDQFGPLPPETIGTIALTLFVFLGLWRLPRAGKNAHGMALILCLSFAVEGCILTHFREDKSTPGQLHPESAFITVLNDSGNSSRYLAYGKSWSPRTKNLNGRDVYDLSLVGLINLKYPFLMPGMNQLLAPLRSLDGVHPMNPLDYRVFTFAPSLMAGNAPLKWNSIFPGTTEASFPFYESPVFDMLGLKHLITQVKLEKNTSYRLAYTDGAVNVYENARAHPPAWLVADAHVEPDRMKILKMLSDTSHDWLREAVFEVSPTESSSTATRYGLVPSVPQSGPVLRFGDASWLVGKSLSPRVPASNPSGGSRQSSPVSGSVRVASRSSGDIVYRVSCDRGAYLIVSENFYPGWQATVNGQPADIYRANYTLMGIRIDADTETVTLRFRPPLLSAASKLSGLGLLVLLLFLTPSLSARLRRRATSLLQRYEAQFLCLTPGSENKSDSDLAIYGPGKYSVGTQLRNVPAVPGRRKPSTQTSSERWIEGRQLPDDGNNAIEIDDFEGANR